VVGNHSLNNAGSIIYIIGDGLCAYLKKKKKKHVVFFNKNKHPFLIFEQM